MLLIVDTEGRPTTLQVINPLGHGLDEEALRAVQQWRFRPATYQGKPVPVILDVDVNFKLY